MSKIYLFFGSLLLLLSLTVLPSPALAEADCSEPPATPVVYRTHRATTSGHLILKWSPIAHSERVEIQYGYQSGDYLFGALNIGNSNSWEYRVRYLQPGTRYYFRMRGVCDNTEGPWSKEFSQVAP